MQICTDITPMKWIAMCLWSDNVAGTSIFGSIITLPTLLELCVLF